MTQNIYDNDEFFWRATRATSTASGATEVM
jgi:hypothetical protein